MTLCTPRDVRFIRREGYRATKPPVTSAFSPSKFDEMISAGLMPRPKRIGSRVVWDRLKLEAAFSDLPDDNIANPLDRMLHVK